MNRTLMSLLLTLALAHIPLSASAAEPTQAVKTIEANGLTFSYVEAGSGPLIMLIHGFPDTPYTWNHIRPALVEAGYRVVSPWNRGYAPTEVPADAETISSELQGQDVIALIDALGEDSAIIVGHDWGASAVYAAATLAPEKVEKLVTLAIPHPGSLSPNLRQAWAARHFVYLAGRRGVKKMSKNDFHHVDVLYARWGEGWTPEPAQLEAVKSALRPEGATNAVLGYYRGAGDSDEFFAQPISVPTLAICGEDDILGAEDFAAAEGHFSGPYEYVCLPGAHWPHQHNPEAFEAALMNFIGEANAQ